MANSGVGDISGPPFNRAPFDCGLIMAVFILGHLIEYGQNPGVIPILIRITPKADAYSRGTMIDAEA